MVPNHIAVPMGAPEPQTSEGHRRASESSPEMEAEAPAPSLSERRHRLNMLEVPEVIEALKLRLRYHLEDRGSLLEAAIAFRAYYRLVTHCRGKPSYPEPITWSLIEDFVELGPFQLTVPLAEVEA